MVREPEKVIILDFLPFGYPDARKTVPVVQFIGRSSLSLFEGIVREGATFKPYDEIMVPHPDIIKYRVLAYDRLTDVAKSELPYVVEKIVTEEEKRFVDFFNKAESITTRLHQLELLPGIGKRLLWRIIEEREKEPFKSFEDIKKRIPQIPDPKKAIVSRILQELSNPEEKYRIFVKYVYIPRKRF